MSIPSLHLLPASHQQPSLCFETGGRTHSFMSLNLSGPYKTQRPKLGHHWPTLAKPCRFLSGGGTVADPRHPQLPCAGGQEAFLLHHARWSMGTVLFVYIGYTRTSDFLSICCCCPKMLHTRSPIAYRPVTSKLVGFKCLCSYSSRYRPAEPRAQSISPAPQQPDLYTPTILGRSRRNPSHGEDTTRTRPEHISDIWDVPPRRDPQDPPLRPPAGPQQWWEVAQLLSPLTLMASLGGSWRLYPMP